MPPLPVTALEMQPTRVETSVEAVAQTEGAREVEVRARVGGILEKRVFEEGSPVKAGQALYQIDRAPLEDRRRPGQGPARRGQARANRPSARPPASRACWPSRPSASANTTPPAPTTRRPAVQAAAALRQAELNLSYVHRHRPGGRHHRPRGGLRRHPARTGGGTLLTTVVQVNPMWVRFSVSQAELNAAMPGGRFKPHPRRRAGAARRQHLPVRGKLNFAASQIDPSSAPCSCAASSPTRTAPCCPASSCAPACSPANATASSRCPRP
jgi:membrane fusion protein (multidrug efflux system)